MIFNDFQDLAKQIPKEASTVIVRMDRMQYVDQSGLYALEDVLTELIDGDKKVFFVNLVEQPKYMMERIDIIPDLIPKNHIFENFEDCLKWIKENDENN